ncbi:MAG: carbohydrate-binding protein [Pedosphaera sp.]|nr:carbohydrate-binding protein [Pedosphaera sp.]
MALTLTGCATTPLRVQHVEFGQSIWSEGQRQGNVLFQDGAQSFPVEGGTLWLFGDTFIGQAQGDQPPGRAQIKGARATTIAWLPGSRTNLPPKLEYFADQTGVAAYPLSLFPEESPERNRMWPLGGVTLGPRTYLYYVMIEKTGEKGPWNFRGMGGGLAVAAHPLHQYDRLRPDGQWKFPVEPIQVVREGDWLYLFEVSSEPKGLILARVRCDEIEQPKAYEFFTGEGWAKDRAKVRVILREAYGQVSVMRLPERRSYLMATSSDFSHPREIQLREAKNLEGPWGEPMRIAVPEFPGKKTSLVYCAFLHPELSDAKSLRLDATFCRILEGDWELTNPEWVTIKLAK